MGMFKWFSGLFGHEEEIERPANVIREPISSLRIVRVKPAEPHKESVINPATGLPMIGGMAGHDALGNPYGLDMDDALIDSDLNPHHDPFDSDDSWMSDPFDPFD